MRGITEEKLLKLRTKYKSNIVNKLIDYLIKECTELNAWQPIDKNTPKDKNILVYDPVYYGQLVVIWSESYNLWITVFGRKLTRPPTHWQELPKDPK